MESNIILIALGAAVIGLILGLAISKAREKSNASQLTKNAKREVNSIISKAKLEGDSIKKDKMFQAKERFLELKSEHEQVILSREKKMSEAEKRTRDKESQISSELSKNKKLSTEFESKIKDYDHRLQILNKRKEELDKAHKSQILQLEVISGLSAEDAKHQLVESLKSEAKNDAMVFIQDTMEEAKLTGFSLDNPMTFPSSNPFVIRFQFRLKNLTLDYIEFIVGNAKQARVVFQFL